MQCHMLPPAASLARYPLLSATLQARSTSFRKSSMLPLRDRARYHTGR